MRRPTGRNQTKGNLMFYTVDHMEELALIDASQAQRAAGYDYVALDNDEGYKDDEEE